MAATVQPLTREGTVPNRAGRVGVAEAMARLLDDGRRFTDPLVELHAEELRGWAGRLVVLARDLADCLEAPLRNRIMELLDSPSLPDNECALAALRLNVAGTSTAGLGEQCGIAGQTVERIEGGNACQPRVAKSLADRFALSVSELFDTAGDSLIARTVGGLREVMVTPRGAHGLRA